MAIDTAAIIAEHREALACVEGLQSEIEAAIALIEQALNADNTLFACGNGGSASDAQHFAAELTGRFERDRRGYPAIALTTDCSALTSIGNDYGFEYLYSRQLSALGREGDVLVAMSTSGNSANVIKAVEHAQASGIKTIGLLGRDGGKLKEMVDVALTIEVTRTARIQEMHILLLHMFCEPFEI
jgi:D-sedoheptulose 7-phosphate isomerase